MANRYTADDVAHAREMLTRFGVTPGARLYTMISHVSRSGMQRRVRVFVAIVGEDGKPEIAELTCFAAKVAGYSLREGDIIVGGCGFDAGHDVVYNLGRALYPDAVRPRGGDIFRHDRM